ncbi:MAG: ShlB/FhaC/HecB family hemolysin secretion/activation protein [Planctomycetota bacterium]|jgi:hemolysin activation/secretion protein
MGSSIQRKVVVLIALLFLIPAVFAEDKREIRKTELEKALGKLRSTIEQTSVDEVNFPEDTTPRLLVKELRISGNNLISTARLLEEMPMVYKLPVKKGDELVDDVYDFRVLRDIILDPGEEHQVSSRTIQGFTKYVLSVYQDEGYAGIYVYVPAAAIDESTLKLLDQILPVQVLEGTVAELNVDRYDFDRQDREEGYLKESLIESWSPVKVGDVIQKKKTDDFVGLLNLNPDRYVSAVISRSADPNALRLSYDVYEANPWHWYVQVDNAGTEDRQWSPKLGLINTNLTGGDDRFSAMYQAPWEKGIEDEYAVFGSYDFPLLTPRLRLNLYAGYSQFDIPETGISFLGNGSFFGGILTYNVFQADGWFVDLTGSYSHERSKVTPSLGIATDVDMDLWGVGVKVHRSDDMSGTSLSFNTATNTSGTDAKDVEAVLRLEDSDFTIYNFTASHNRYLDMNKVNRLSGTFRFITSDERLVPAKMTTFGGLYSIRGYEEDEIVADGGILASVQYEFDMVKHGEARGEEGEGLDQQGEEEPWLRRFAPLAFVDFGRAKTKDPLPGEQEVRELCSLGTGSIIEVGDNFTAGIYYGWPLRSTEQTNEGKGRWNFSFIYRF